MIVHIKLSCSYTFVYVMFITLCNMLFTWFLILKLAWTLQNAYVLLSLLKGTNYFLFCFTFYQLFIWCLCSSGLQVYFINLRSCICLILFTSIYLFLCFILLILLIIVFYCNFSNVVSFIIIGLTSFKWNVVF